MPDKLFQTIERFKLAIGLSVVGIVLIIGGIFASGLSKQKPKDFPKESLVQVEKFISVDVSGAVKKAGVYQLKDGARIQEAIAAAEGFAENANGEFISKYLNLAQKLSDGFKVYVPFEGEQASASQTSVAGNNAQAKVNINTATQAEIETLPGIGPATASKIISARPYQKIEEVLDKKIVSKAVFEKIKDLVVTY